MLIGIAVSLCQIGPLGLLGVRAFFEPVLAIGNRLKGPFHKLEQRAGEAHHIFHESLP
jgi:hypothetical protein